MRLLRGAATSKSYNAAKAHDGMRMHRDGDLLFDFCEYSGKNAERNSTFGVEVSIDDVLMMVTEMVKFNGDWRERIEDAIEQAEPDLITVRRELGLIDKKFKVVAPGLTPLEENELLDEYELIDAQERYGPDNFSVEELPDLYGVPAQGSDTPSSRE
jgi:hypothetical protein